MTNDTTAPDGDAIATEEDFKKALQGLVVSACENETDPRGSWVVRNGASMPDWEIHITELAKQNENE